MSVSWIQYAFVVLLILEEEFLKTNEIIILAKLIAPVMPLSASIDTKIHCGVIISLLEMLPSFF